MKATLQLVVRTWSLVILINLGVAVQGDRVGSQVSAHLVSGTIVRRSKWWVVDHQYVSLRFDGSCYKAALGKEG